MHEWRASRPGRLHIGEVSHEAQDFDYSRFHRHSRAGAFRLRPWQGGRRLQRPHRRPELGQRQLPRPGGGLHPEARLRLPGAAHLRRHAADHGGPLRGKERSDHGALVRQHQGSVRPRRKERQGQDAGRQHARQRTGLVHPALRPEGEPGLKVGLRSGEVQAPLQRPRRTLQGPVRELHPRLGVRGHQHGEIARLRAGEALHQFQAGFGRRARGGHQGGVSQEKTGPGLLLGADAAPGTTRPHPARRNPSGARPTGTR